MSLPHSKILKASKSILAVADLNHNSPSNQASQNVNVIVNSAPTNPEYSKNLKPSVEQKAAYPTNNENPYKDVESSGNMETAFKSRDIESAMNKTEEISENIDDKENTIKALTLIIEILQSNPLIVNKFVIAEIETLAELIRLLTNADSVEIDCADIECSCTKIKYQTIKRIYITKDKEVYSIFQCPVILKLFDNYKISLNFVI